MRIDLPSAILSATLSAYWSGVAATALANRWRHGGSAGIWPSSRTERSLWPIWVPLVVLWNVLPWLAVSSRRYAVGVPPEVSICWRTASVRRLVKPRQPAYAGRSPTSRGIPHAGWKALRLVAALLGFGCFAATVVCWARLGRNWSMAVVPGQKAELVRTGPYAVVRHPIYALSIALMLCSIVVVPTLPMFVLAALHLPFVWTKARSEEQFLCAIHGGSYTDYCRRTGRFFPRWRMEQS